MPSNRYVKFAEFMSRLAIMPMPFFFFVLSLTLVLWIGLIGILSQYNPYNSESGADATLQLVFFCFALAATTPALPFEHLKFKLPIVVGASILAGTGLLVGYGITNLFWVVNESLTTIGGIILICSIFALSVAISILALESLTTAFKAVTSRN